MAPEKDKKRKARLRADREFIEAAATPMFVVDADGSVLTANRAATDLLGAQLEKAPLALRFADEDAVNRITSARRAVDDADRKLLLATTRDGRSFHTELALGSERADGSVIVTAREIQPRDTAHPNGILANRYRQLFDHNLAGIYRSDLDGRVFDCNDSFAHMLGFASRAALLESGDTSPYLEPHEREWLFTELEKDRTMARVEVCLRKADGTPVWALQNLALIDDGDGRFVEGTAFDITARRLAEEQIAYQSNYDALTGLPNPSLLRERLDVALSQSGRAARHVCVAFLDLDHFKAINDTLSHRIGDQLLQLVAYRLQNCLREYDTVARLGGDEFTVILQHVKTREDAAHTARRALR